MIPTFRTLLGVYTRPFNVSPFKLGGAEVARISEQKTIVLNTFGRWVERSQCIKCIKQPTATPNFKENFIARWIKRHVMEWTNGSLYYTQSLIEGKLNLPKTIVSTFTASKRGEPVPTISIRNFASQNFFEHRVSRIVVSYGDGRVRWNYAVNLFNCSTLSKRL